MKIILSLLVLLCASVAEPAQQTTLSAKKPALACHRCIRRSPKRLAASPAPASQPSSDFFVGEAKVDVTKDETVVRLAMAQHGSVLIELPAKDGPRYIIPGDPEMATVDEKALERNKRAIVVRPGSLFLSPALNHKARTPAATVTLQMRSGLVVTFLFYPVEDLAQNVHRCVLSYNRDEVVARRRAAGLPVNLDTTISERRNETGQSTAPTSISVETGNDNKTPDKDWSEKPTITIQVEKDSKVKAETTDKAPPVPASAEAAATKSEQKTNESNDRVTSVARDALARAIKKPKQFKAWTKPVHGLTLATIQQAGPNDDFRVVVLAIKNTSTEALKIIPGHPDLSLEMLDDQARPINVQSIKKLHTEVSDASGAIPAGGTTYYAIAYLSPVLGVHQQMKILVSQTSAADEPASITLANNQR
jgi:hypothetical protein